MSKKKEKSEPATTETNCIDPAQLELGAKLIFPETKPFVSSPPLFHFALREDVKNEKQFLPTRAEPLATGWDVKACPVDRKPIRIKPFQYVKIDLGFRVKCPDGWWLRLAPRSSSFAKKKMHFLYGTIDNLYSGSMLAAFQYIPEAIINVESNHIFGYYGDEHNITSEASFANDELVVEFGESIAQLIPFRLEEMTVNEVSNDEIEKMYAERGVLRDGFGSTDKR